MRIKQIICPKDIEEKLQVLRGITANDVRQVLLSRPRILFSERVYLKGEDVYAAFGRTYSGRYLVVFFVYKSDSKRAIIISAREMSDQEQKNYGRK